MNNSAHFRVQVPSHQPMGLCTLFVRSACRRLGGVHDALAYSPRYVFQYSVFSSPRCARTVATAAVDAAADGFYAADAASFASLGLHPRVCESLASAGFDRPALVQVSGAPAESPACA
jgi:hypothetical protein